MERCGWKVWMEGVMCVGVDEKVCGWEGVMCVGVDGK